MSIKIQTNIDVHKFEYTSITCKRIFYDPHIFEYEGIFLFVGKSHYEMTFFLLGDHDVWL